MAHTRELLADLREFDNTAEGDAFELRLDLADIIFRHLDGKKMTQNKLAEVTGKKPPFITRILHAESNCTFQVACELLFALGVKVKLVEAQELAGNSRFSLVYDQPISIRQGQTYGKAEIKAGSTHCIQGRSWQAAS